MPSCEEQKDPQLNPSRWSRLRLVFIFSRNQVQQGVKHASSTQKAKLLPRGVLNVWTPMAFNFLMRQNWTQGYSLVTCVQWTNKKAGHSKTDIENLILVVRSHNNQYNKATICNEQWISVLIFLFLVHTSVACENINWAVKLLVYIFTVRRNIIMIFVQ